MLVSHSLACRERIEWDQEQEEYAQERVAQQMQTAVPAEIQQELNENPASYWDQFYANVKGESESRTFRSPPVG